ncbi:hypothetical protein [Anabaena azotica]|uniref:Uncharacterized protein n=1 Tax=Anabaena azotica FACHB-119 TaxID=947527 RepID=A0ABR8DHH0_9NOST|nr:hypothetical protein [Anabaena azotica]MBD2505208.1 hypothetical protein [Anabaena azotica FACHB-119]
MFITSRDEGNSMVNRYLRKTRKIFLSASARVEDIEHIDNWGTNCFIGSVTLGCLFAANKTTKNTDLKFGNCY